MPVPTEQIFLVDSNGKEVDHDSLVAQLRTDRKRVLVDDEVGLVIYVADLGIYMLTPTDSGEFLAQQVTEMSRPRFSTRVVRKQIGHTVLSVTADAVFVVLENNSLKKVRAEKLEPGMILASGEKVYR